jgi:hypothetical protein
MPKKGSGEGEIPTVAAPPSSAPNKDLRSMVVPDVIPHLLGGGGLNTFTGGSGVGKTAMMADWIKRLIEGKSLFGRKPREIPKIGIIFTDRRWEKARFWFDKAGVEEGDRFEAYCIQDDSALKFKDFRNPNNTQKFFEQHVESLNLPPGSLLLVDPISTYLSGRLNDYSYVVGSMIPLNRFLAEKGLTCWGTMHVAKSKGDRDERLLRPQDRALGSVALAGFSNTQFYLIGPEETNEDWYLCGFMSHELPQESWRFRRDSKGLFIPVDGKPYLGAGTEKVTSLSAAKLAQMEKLLQVIPENDVSDLPTLLEDAHNADMNISMMTLRRYLDDLIARGDVTKPNRGQYQRVKKESQPNAGKEA